MFLVAAVGDDDAEVELTLQELLEHVLAKFDE